MKINSSKMGFSCAIAFSVAWVLCSLMVVMMPNIMLFITGGMVHVDLSSLEWEMKLSTVVIGLIGWSLSAGCLGWLISTLYNKIQIMR